MFDARVSTLLRRAARVIARPPAATADSTLLDRYARDRDPAAFAELVARHGPAVWGLCRRLVRTEADAEDVFQATFLVLARDAGRVRKAASVGSWLFGVAARLGRKARVRLDRPPPDPWHLTPPAAAPDPAAGVTWAEVRAALDEELARLPDELRAPLLLCYFDGLTQDEAAAALGWNPRTLKARVARGRDVLRSRLTRRGVELPAVLAAPLLSAGVASAVPPHLASAAAGLARRHPPGPAVSPAVLALAQTEVSAMTAARLALASAAVLLIAGAVFDLRGEPAADPQPAPPTADVPAPAGAVAIGTAQFRYAGWHSRVVLADQGKTLILVGEGPVVVFWDVAAGRKLHEIRPKGNYRAAAFAPGADVLALVGSHQPDGKTGGPEAALWLIDAAGRKLIRTVGLPGSRHGAFDKVGISGDGKRVFVESEGEVRVIDGTTGDELLRHKGQVNAGTLTVSSDGKLVLFGRGEMFLWRWETGEEPKKIAAVGGFVTGLIQFAPDGRTLYATDDRSGVLHTWDVATGRQIEAKSFGPAPDLLSLSPDGQTLAVATAETTSHPAERVVRLLEVGTWNEVGRLPAGRDRLAHASWSKDGSRLAGVSSYRAWVWDVKTGKELGPSRTGHEGLIGGLAFGPDGTLFTGSDDGTVRSWDSATGAPRLKLEQDGWVRGVAVSPDGSLVAGSGLNNDLRVWDVKTGRPRFRLLGNGRSGGKRLVRFTPDGTRLVAWGDDEVVRVWDVRTGKLLAENTTRPADDKPDPDDPFEVSRRLTRAAFGAAAISPDGSALALAVGKRVRILGTMTGRELPWLDTGEQWPQSLALSPDGKRLAVAFRAESIETKLPDGRVRDSVEEHYPVSVWNLATGKPVWTATVEGTSPRVAYSPDGARVAVMATISGKPGRVWVFDAAVGKPAGRIELPHRGGHLAFDRTGRRLAVSLWDTTAVVYDLTTALK